MNRLSPHQIALLQALFVTFLWSTSWVLIKIGLATLPALTFAGLRYGIAFLCLAGWALARGDLAPLRCLDRSAWLQVIALGVLLYTVTQGAQFLGLRFLPAVTVGLILTFTPVLVALLSQATLGEATTRAQWAGLMLFLLGTAIYFAPVQLAASEAVGLLVVAVGLGSNAAAAVLGRHVNRANVLPPLPLTVASMGIGAALLLITGIVTQGLPVLTAPEWGIVLWLAVVNTAFAFTLWNQTLRTLSALESSLINNTMLVQIAILAWFFLGEAITGKEGVGLLVAIVGVLIVQFHRTPAPRASTLEVR